MGIWDKGILSLFCKTPIKSRAAVSHQGGPGTNQSNQEESEKSWAVSHEQSLSGTPVPYCVPVFGPLLQGLHYMVRQPLESSSAFSSKVSHALLRGHLGWLPSLLVGKGMASCPWCWMVPALKKHTQQKLQCHLGAHWEPCSHPRARESEFATDQAPTQFACTFKSEAPCSRPVFLSCRLHPNLESRN